MTALRAHAVSLDSEDSLLSLLLEAEGSPEDEDEGSSLELDESLSPEDEEK